MWIGNLVGIISSMIGASIGGLVVFYIGGYIIRDSIKKMWKNN